MASSIHRRDELRSLIAQLGIANIAATASLRACLDRNSSIKMTESSARSLSVRGTHGLGFDLSTARSASEGAASGSLDGIKPIHFVPQGDTDFCTSASSTVSVGVAVDPNLCAIPSEVHLSYQILA